MHYWRQHNIQQAYREAWLRHDDRLVDPLELHDHCLPEEHCGSKYGKKLEIKEPLINFTDAELD